MGRATPEEDLQDDKDTAFTWEVRANNAAFHEQFLEKGFLCWRRRKYQTNRIHTAKYNVFSFLPLNLYEQFHRVSNLYFLLIVILQTIPEIATLPWISILLPLLCLLFIRATRDLMDDIGRHRSDNVINNRPCQKLIRKSFKWRKWKDLCVGDIVCVTRDSIVPADLLLLASTEPSSLCYLETADIDGETNLKFRQALAVTHHELVCSKTMAAFNGTVMCEQPNSRMHQFVGSLDWKGRQYGLDISNVLLRGSRVRNTDACYGLVIYAGFDTKIMKNCGDIHLKRTKIDLFMNKLVILIFLLIVVISILLSMGYWLQIIDLKNTHHYIPVEPGTQGQLLETFLVFWAFLILLSVMVPLAMFIITEFIYLGNSMFINWDLHMYHAPHDVPAKARSTSLNDYLGQVHYVFSDKTGTLTQNVMSFKKCCIAGRVYGPDNEDGIPPKENPYLWNTFADGRLSFFNEELLRIVLGKQDKAVQEFWRLLAICHTVMVQEKDNQLLYQAASPDEEALVTAARNFGYVFLSRTQDSITVVELGEERTYEVLALMDFNSDRKCMSVLVRTPEGSICLYTKGADTVIFQRLYKKGVMESNTEKILTAFTEQTLRTLCVAYKEVEESVYQQWQLRLEAASVQLQDRAQALQQVYSDMEQGLQLLGVTAIEDKLQDGVPDTISSLKKANIKVWVLTGDKQETAVNIGFACQLLTENMHILEARDVNIFLDSHGERSRLLRAARRSLRFQLQNDVAMVVSGEFLDQLLVSLRQEPRVVIQGELEDEARPETNTIRRISMMWSSLGASLATHRSKRSKLQLKQESPEARRERAFVDLASGCQAVICCRVTPKQKALIVALVKKYQQAVTLAIGDGANDVNMIKTADIGVGLAGQEGTQAVQNSDFALGQFCFLQRLLLVHGRWSYMRVCKFLRYFFYKTMASLASQFWFAFYTGFSAQPLYEGWFLSLYNLLYSTLPVLYVGLFEQIMLIVRYWTFLFVGTVLLSLGCYFVMTYITQSLWLYRLFPKTFPFLYALHNVLTKASLLLVLLLNVVVSILPTLAYRIYQHTVKEPRFKEEAEVPPSEEVSEEPLPLRRQSRVRRSSYAFSHYEGYGDLITQGKILRRPRRDSSDTNVNISAALPSEVEELPSAPPEPRKISFLANPMLQLRSRATSQDAGQDQWTGPGGQGRWLEPSLPEAPLSQERSWSVAEAQAPALARPSLPWGQGSGSGAPPLQTQDSLSEQAMETESGSLEREPSPMEWLPEYFQEVPMPPPPGQPALNAKDKEAVPYAFSNKPRSA
ncbi:phospholipid-transporting ATPase IK isoform X3 [Cavia porcellus]|uniref:phospholipid-transporting ATPase IK isoform X3 n=1 Tax=Cavia porcellus TaxID=10141 RepID=UPI002FE09A03